MNRTSAVALTVAALLISAALWVNYVAVASRPLEGQNLAEIATPSPTPVAITVGTNPTGLAFSVDSVNYNSTQTFSWPLGSSHSLSTTSPQNIGSDTRYLWHDWNDYGAQTHDIFVTGALNTYTANFTTQYRLAMCCYAVSPPTGFFDAGQSVQISAFPPCSWSVYWFGSGNGSYTGGAFQATVVMNEPITETAVFEGPSCSPSPPRTPTPTPTPTPSLSPLPTPSPTCAGSSLYWVHFSNPEPIAPADRASNDPGTLPGLPTNYPSTIHVTSFDGDWPAEPRTCLVGPPVVTFPITSERPDDLDILLVNPVGSRSLVISDAGGNNAITNFGYLVGRGSTFFPDEITPVPGYYREANYAGLLGPEPDGMDNFPNAGGLANYQANLLMLQCCGMPLSGDWQLYVVDDETGNLSSLPEGWRISFFWECHAGGGCPSPTPSPTRTPTPTPTPTPFTPTPSPSPTCVPIYTIDRDFCPPPLIAAVTDIGNHCDDCTTTITLPFSVGLYDQFFSTLTLDSNGKVSFVGGDTVFANTCLPQANAAFSVYPYWDDLRTETVLGACTQYAGAQCGIFTTVSGTPPNRTILIEWRTVYFSNNAQRANFEVRFYEGQARFDAIYGIVDQSNMNATAGVQRDVTNWTQLFCNGSGGPATGRLDYRLGGCGIPTPSPSLPPPCPSPPPFIRSPHFDYDGDGRSDVSVFRPVETNWYLLRSRDGFTATNFGLLTDQVAPADFDGDGKTDIGVYRPSQGVWYWLNSSTGTLSAVPFGTGEDLPTPADYDGDRHADVSVFRPSNGVWYRLNSSNGSFYAVQFGLSEDKPTIGDYDGDGRADVAVWRPSNGAWYRLNSSNGAFVAVAFGLSDDLITPADFDGDGKTDVAVYRASTGTWYSLDSSNGALRATQFGASEDVPTAADFDGDVRADISVFRPSDGVWYRLNSATGAFVAIQFGTNGDRPTPAAFRY